MVLYFNNDHDWPYLMDFSNKNLKYLIFENKYKYRIKILKIKSKKENGWSAIIILKNNTVIIFDSILDSENKLHRILTIQNPDGTQIIRQDKTNDKYIFKNWWEDIQDFGKLNLFQKIMLKIKNIFGINN